LAACVDDTFHCDGPVLEQCEDGSFEPVTTCSAPSICSEPWNSCVGPVLVPDTGGWVSRHSNSIGVEGQWYVFGSEGSSYTAPLPEQGWPNAGEGTLCASGEAAEALDGDFDRYWGVGGGFDLCAGNALGDCPWETRLDAMTGIAFTVDTSFGGGVLPPRFEIRFQTDEDVALVAVPIDGDGRVELRFGAAAPADVARVRSVYYFVFSAEGAPTPFNFCLSDVTVLED
jgi:hypothetical protein